MKYLHLLGLLAVAGIALSFGIALQARRGPPPPAVPDTVYLTLSAESKAVADGTKTATATGRTAVDSLRRLLRARRVDTVTVYDTVTEDRLIERFDTVLVRCDECAVQLAKHRAFTDSAMKAKDDSIAKLHAALRACRGGRPWWALGGLATGVLACRAG